LDFESDQQEEEEDEEEMVRENQLSSYLKQVMLPNIKEKEDFLDDDHDQSPSFPLMKKLQILPSPQLHYLVESLLLKLNKSLVENDELNEKMKDLSIQISELSNVKAKSTTSDKLMEKQAKKLLKMSKLTQRTKKLRGLCENQEMVIERLESILKEKMEAIGSLETSLSQAHINPSKGEEEDSHQLIGSNSSTTSISDQIKMELDQKKKLKEEEDKKKHDVEVEEERIANQFKEKNNKILLLEDELSFKKHRIQVLESRMEEITSSASHEISHLKSRILELEIDLELFTSSSSSSRPSSIRSNQSKKSKGDEEIKKKKMNEQEEMKKYSSEPPPISLINQQSPNSSNEDGRNNKAKSESTIHQKKKKKKESRAEIEFIHHDENDEEGGEFEDQSNLSSSNPQIFSSQSVISEYGSERDEEISQHESSNQSTSNSPSVSQDGEQLRRKRMDEIDDFLNKTPTSLSRPQTMKLLKQKLKQQQQQDEEKEGRNGTTTPRTPKSPSSAKRESRSAGRRSINSRNRLLTSPFNDLDQLKAKKDSFNIQQLSHRPPSSSSSSSNGSLLSSLTRPLSSQLLDNDSNHLLHPENVTNNRRSRSLLDET